MSAAELRRLPHINRWTAVFMSGCVIMALAYSVINPLFEAPDELLHYQFIRHFVTQRALPVQSVDTPTEFHQPPSSNWLIGQVVSDTYELKIRLDTPPGVYDIEVGLYDPVKNFERLRVVTDDSRITENFVLLGKVRVR